MIWQLREVRIAPEVTKTFFYISLSLSLSNLIFAIGTFYQRVTYCDNNSRAKSSSQTYKTTSSPHGSVSSRTSGVLIALIRSMQAPLFEHHVILRTWNSKSRSILATPNGKTLNLTANQMGREARANRDKFEVKIERHSSSEINSDPVNHTASSPGALNRVLVDQCQWRRRWRL